MNSYLNGTMTLKSGIDREDSDEGSRKVAKTQMKRWSVFLFRAFPSLREVLLCGLSWILLSSTSLQAADRPNIVIILADDYGYGSAGCYGADGKLVRTPNIDRLAREGRRFTDANTTSSVCSPTRY